MIVNVKAALAQSLPAVNLFQHELSHVFGCGDHAHNPASMNPYVTGCCLMCRDCRLDYTGYCYNGHDCDLKLWINWVRFDEKGYANSATIEEFGSGRVYDKDKITGSIADRGYTQLDSGSSGSRAVVYVIMYNLNNPGASLSGTVYLRGYSITYGSHMYVTASNDGVNWTVVANINYYSNP
jgi:hypothetical protein